MVAQVVEGFDYKMDLHLSTLVMNECTSRIGIHRDPATPMPAMVQGRTLHHMSPDGTSVPVGRGGRLFLADGLFDLSYGPYDVVLLDGNLAHGITCLRALPGQGDRRGRTPLVRSSTILFNRFKKEKEKFGYSGDWQAAWMADVLWLPGCEPQMLPRERKRTVAQIFGADWVA